jgi:hypothetical protein
MKFMQSFHFIADREISEDVLLSVLRTVVPVRRLVQVNDQQSAAEDDGNDVFVLYVELQTWKGQFGRQYRLYSPAPSQSLTRREEIELMRGMARQSGASILADDEGENPFVFVHIDSLGETSVVCVEPEAYNDRDELNIEGAYFQHWGTFAAETPLHEDEISKLDRLLSDLLFTYHLEHLEDGPVPIEFGRYKNSFPRLRNFIHHYFIRTDGKQPWFSKEEKSVRFTGVMTEFHEQAKRKVVVFPANGRVVRNIPGGSDSEAHCILIDDEECMKIVYKPCRESW